MNGMDEANKEQDWSNKIGMTSPNYSAA